MKNSDAIENIGEFIVVDDKNDFTLLYEDSKKVGDYLEKKYFTSLEFENTDFSKIEGVENIFEKCTFSKVVFQKSYFKDCLFKNCDFSNCDFDNSNFTNCKFQNIKGLGANFSESIFKNIDIKDCMFRYAVFTSSLFNSCNISETDMSESYIDTCKFKKMNLNKVDLIRANLYKTLLKGVDLRNCQINGIILSNEAKELNGAVVEVFQAAELARLLGVVIK